MCIFFVLSNTMPELLTGYVSYMTKNKASTYLKKIKNQGSFYLLTFWSSFSLRQLQIEPSRTAVIQRVSVFY